MSWRYTDTADRIVAVDECTDPGIGAHVAIGGTTGYRVIVCIPADERRKAAQALAGDEYRVVPRDLTVGDLQQIARDAGVRLDMDAQPDRPEPVDPASVRVGDVVEIEADEWMVRGKAGSWVDNYSEMRVDICGGRLAEVQVGGATVRILHPADPEPDPAAVEALRQVMRDTFRVGSSPGVELDEEWIERHALALAKRNVRVVSTGE